MLLYMLITRRRAVSAAASTGRRLKLEWPFRQSFFHLVATPSDTCAWQSNLTDHQLDHTFAHDRGQHVLLPDIPVLISGLARRHRIGTQLPISK